jgi:MFS superfamily sulfate permease-like transporter
MTVVVAAQLEVVCHLIFLVLAVALPLGRLVRSVARLITLPFAAGTGWLILIKTIPLL